MECCGGVEEHEQTCVDVKVKDSINKGTVAAAKALESENYSAGWSTEIETEEEAEEKKIFVGQVSSGCKCNSSCCKIINHIIFL